MLVIFRRDADPVVLKFNADRFTTVIKMGLNEDASVCLSFRKCIERVVNQINESPLHLLRIDFDLPDSGVEDLSDLHLFRALTIKR